MFCKQCGEENRNDRKFCANCGSPLADYTKPREDLVMPDQVLERQNKIKKLKLIRLWLNIFITLFVVLAVVFLAISFAVKGNALLVMSICTIVCCSVAVVLWIVKVVIKGKYKNID